MNAEHFVKFTKTFRDYVEAKKNHPEFTTDTYPDKFENDDDFDKESANESFKIHIQTMIENAKVFEIEDDQKKLLLLSDPPESNDKIRTPFEHIFLDTAFSKEELEDVGITVPENIYRIIGIGITEGKIYDYRDKKKEAGDTIRFSILIEDDKGYQFGTFADFYTLHDEYKDSDDLTLNVTPKSIKKFVHKFFLSFINFVNNPEVELVEHCRSAKSKERREKKGLPVIPSTTTIKITGKLKQYIDDIRQGEGWTYGYRFWIRGHFRDLVSERYIEKKRIWILPFIKGKGILVEKTYTVQKNNLKGGLKNGK